jgi:hypothetical protein
MVTRWLAPNSGGPWSVMLQGVPRARSRARQCNEEKYHVSIDQTCLTGLLIAGALAFSAVGADAVGGNSNDRDAFIGIIGGGCTGSPKGGGRYNACPFNNPDRDAYRNGQGGYGGNGAYHGGPNH